MRSPLREGLRAFPGEWTPSTTPIMPTPKPTSVEDLRCHVDAAGNTQCEATGTGDSPCVDGRKERWVSPGDAVHGRHEELEEVFTDGGQQWARLTNGNVVPVCPGTAPSHATRVRGSTQGVAVGQVQMPQNDTSPSPPDVPGEVPTEQVCPPGWTLGSDGSCVPPTAIATPDPSAAQGHFLREDGTQQPMTFDPPVETVEAEEGALMEMAPDMPPAATPAPGATFDPKTGKLSAPGTMFDGMDVAPYGKGTCPEVYGGGGRAVFFAMGVSKMYAMVVGAAGAPQANPDYSNAPKGSARIRMGKGGPKHGHVAVRDRTTKIVTADPGYFFSVTPLKRPVETFPDVYGRTVYVGKHVWTTPAPAPVTSAVQNAVAVGAVQPRVMQQGPVAPGGMAKVMGGGTPGLPPRNPNWQYEGPMAEVKF